MERLLETATLMAIGLVAMMITVFVITAPILLAIEAENVWWVLVYALYIAASFIFFKMFKK